MTRANESERGSTLGFDYDLSGKSATEVASDLYHVPVLVAIIAVMLWIRLRSYDNFTVDGEVYFSGNDAWYHLREVRYTVQHWPFTMPFDPWTYFPYGTSAGQFGTMYDQLVATAALALGLGSPSAELVARTLLVAPAVFGALTVVPTYLVGKRLGGRLGGLFGAVVLMLLPGTFLSRGLVGFADHNVAEPFFQGFAVVTLMVALAVAGRDRPIWELVEAREWETVRPTLVWSALAGLAVGLYIWVWPPAVLLVGIFGVYLVYQMVSDQANGRSPDHVAFVAVVSMVIAAAMALLRFHEATFAPTEFGFLQPLAALAVAAAAVALAWLARQFDARDFDDDRVNEYGFAGTVLGLVLVGLVVTVVAPVSFFSTIQTNLLRFVGFSAGAGTRTIGEAQPFLQSGLSQYYGPVGVVLAEYGFAFITALAAAVWVLVKPLWARGDSGDYQLIGVAGILLVFIFVARPLYVWLTGLLGVDGQLLGLGLVALLVFAAAVRARYEAEYLFAFVWAAFITSAAFTQVRFNYYLAVAVAAFNAYFLYELLRAVDVDFSTERVPDVETYQVLAVALVVMVVLVPVLTVPLSLGNTGNTGIDRTDTAWQVGNSTSPGAVTVWDQNLEWMGENTPAEGNYGGAGNADQLELYRPYDMPADGDYDYPEGAYGVQSWWDYGHWITVLGERIPNANPFQEGATSAANFLLAPNESQAQDVLASESTEGDQTRYVMVDWQMATAGSKFGAPVVFYDATNVSRSDFLQPVYSTSSQSQQLRFALYEHKQRYYNSTMIRLYKYHGSRMEPTISAGPVGEFVVVFDYETVTTQDDRQIRVLPQGQNATAFRTFRNMTAAEEFVERDGTAKIGGIGAFPNEPVPALEHYRLVQVSDTSAYASQQYQQTALREARAVGLQNPQLLQQTSPNWVKTFERVPGAVVEGSGAAPNETITASVQMEVPPSTAGGNATTFTYEQQATAGPNGNFELTLPYSTEGYDEFGPENGYTNASVRAAGPYTVYGDVQTNESSYVLRNQATLNVSEATVVGAEEGPISVTLDEEVLQEPQEPANESDGNESAANESDGNESLAPPIPSPGSATSSDDAATLAGRIGAGTLAPRVAAPALRAADRSPVHP